jgi:AcrR family transcriptional regulator
MSPRKAAALRGGALSLPELLIATAGRLIGERGTAGLTVRMIARAAGVADGVLYNHFADKEQLLAAGLHAHVRAVENSLGELPEPGTGTVDDNLRAHLAYGSALHRAVLPAFAGLLAQPEVITQFTALASESPQWRDRLAEYLSAERYLGRLDSYADTAAAAAMLVGACHDAVLSGLITPDATPPSPPAVEAVVATILSGIGPRSPSPSRIA